MSFGWTARIDHSSVEQVHTVKGWLSISFILSVEIRFCATRANERSWGWLMEGWRILKELVEDIWNRAFKCQFSGDLASQWYPALVLIHPLGNATSRSKDSQGKDELVAAVQIFTHYSPPTLSIWEQGCDKHSLPHTAQNTASSSFAVSRTKILVHLLSSRQFLEVCLS